MIDKALFWNIRSVNTQNTFGRLFDMNKIYHYSFIALMELFQASKEIEQYKNRIGFDHALANCSEKI